MWRNILGSALLILVSFAIGPVNNYLFGQRGRLGPGAGLQLNCENAGTWSVLAVQRVGPGGQINAVCIPVDGTTIQVEGFTLRIAPGVVGAQGPAGPAGADGDSANFVDAEVPEGLVDGSNRVFELDYKPSPAESLLLTRNGLTLHAGDDYILTDDYTLAGSTITFTVQGAPQAEDLLQAWYRR